jgi:chromate transporter
VLGRRAIFDLPTALIALGTLALLLKLKKAPEPLIILGAGFVGLLLKSPLSL